MIKLPGAACDECPGRDAKCVPPEPARTPPGRVGRRLVVVGEGPGRNEVQQGRPFVGASGQMLMRALRPYTREEVHWTNAIPCDVPERELRKARVACAGRLAVELEALGPDVVVLTVGAHALAAVLGVKRDVAVQKWRGSVIRLGPGGDPSGVRGHPTGGLCLPTVHPAFVMRASEWEPVFDTDVSRAKRIARDGYTSLEDSVPRFVTARTAFDIHEFGMRAGKTVAIDVETDGEEPLLSTMTCFGMSDGRHTIVVPWEGDTVALAAATNEVLATRVALTHNGPAFDHVVLGRHGIRVGAWDDSMTAQHVIAGHLPKRLQHVVTLHLDVPPWKEEHADDPTTLLKYNARDVLYTKRAWDAMQPALSEPWAASLYVADKRCAELCREMQLTGFAFDSERARAFERELRAREAAVEADVAALVGHPMKLLSGKQVHEAFAALGAPVLFRSAKTRAPSYDVDALRAYASGGEWSAEVRTLALKLIDYRHLRKMRGTYVCGPGARVHADGRVHPQWSMRTVTGRFASDLMTLPRRENDPLRSLGGIRSLYVAGPGTRLIAFDAKQLEMRVAAYVSGDEAMIAACESSDLHAANATLIWGAAFRDADPDKRAALRGLAKNAGFAVTYLAEAQTVYTKIVAAGTPVTLRQVEAMLRALRTAFRRYFTWTDEMMSSAIRHGYVSAPLSGRRRYVGHAPEQTKVANYPIQSGAGDIMNARLPAIVEAVRPLGARLVAQVHDAGYFEVTAGAEERVRETADAVFRVPVRFPNGREAVFPLDWHVGCRWSEL